MIANRLLIELFPGISLLGKGFEQAGYCVLRAPDSIWGGDVRQFNPIPLTAEGMMGGPPCPPFSAKTRNPDKQAGIEMLMEFGRCVQTAQPDWWLMENVAGVPDFKIKGYTWQRIDLHAAQFGIPQNRLRHFQFGSRHNKAIVLDRPPVRRQNLKPCVLATDGTRGSSKPDWQEFVQLQGLPADFKLDARVFTLAGRYRMVGNGVPVPMGYALATAIQHAPDASTLKLCACTCGRTITGKQQTATAACRKRLQRRRNGSQPCVEM